jgi:CRP-like cAMP-binding protein
MNEIEAILPRVHFLREESEEARRDLARSAIARTYPKGNLLFCHGDPCTALFIIMQGRAKVSLLSDEGREMVLTTMRTGQAIGLDAVLTQQTCFGACTTLTEARIARIPRDAFMGWIRRNPHVMEPLLAEFSHRLRAAYEMLGAQALLPVKKRLLMTLVDIARAEGIPTRSGEVSFVRPTHQELAELVGSTRVVISRLLKEILEEQHSFEARGNVIRVYLDDLVPTEEFSA